MSDAKRKRVAKPAAKPEQGPEGRLDLLDNCWLDFRRRPFSAAEAGELFALLQQEDWKQRSLTFFGKSVLEPRLQQYQGANATLSYKYSGLVVEPVPFSPAVLRVRERVAALFPELPSDHFNTVLMNYYRDGKDSQGMHDDADTLRYGKLPTIASVSFGSGRDFVLQRKDRSHAGLTYSLGEGAVLLMGGETQDFWKHGVPKVRPGAAFTA